MPTETWNRLPPARREAVLNAAEAEFAEHGFSRGSLNVIAREAGVAKGSLFQYFDDKIDLFAYLSERAVGRVEAAMGGVVDGIDWSGPFFPAFTELVDAWLQHFLTHPVDRAMSAAVFLEPDPAARSVVLGIVEGHLLAFLGPLFHRARDEGWLRPDADLDTFLSLSLLVLPHLALAPTHPELDPVLGLGGEDPSDGVRRLIATFETAFGA